MPPCAATHLNATGKYPYVLRRRVNEVMINAYAPELLLQMMSNMDCKYVGSERAAGYTVGYTTKEEYEQSLESLQRALI